MGKKDDTKIWCPVNINSWMLGSMRLDLEPDERSVWADLVFMAYRDYGYIRANEFTPYPIKILAAQLVIPEELLIRTIEKCKVSKNPNEKPRIEETKYGTLFLTGHETHKLSRATVYRHNKEMDGGVNHGKVRPENKK